MESVWSFCRCLTYLIDYDCCAINSPKASLTARDRGIYEPELAGDAVSDNTRSNHWLRKCARSSCHLAFCGNRSKRCKLATFSNLAYLASYYIRSTFYVRVLCQWADFMIRTSTHMSSWKSNGTISYLPTVADFSPLPHPTLPSKCPASSFLRVEVFFNYYGRPLSQKGKRDWLK